MIHLDRRAALLAIALPVLATAVSPAIASDPALIAARNRNPALKAYSFHVDIAARMHTFPWMRFHLGGTGKWVRGERYGVQLTEVPFFAKGVNTIDLSPLDPTMWHDNFIVRLAGRKDGMSIFDLQERRIDPNESNPLQSAEVTLDENDATRQVVLKYANGQIQLTLDPHEMHGFRLPASSDIEIRMPGKNLSAHADFTGYKIEQTSAVALDT